MEITCLSFVQVLIELLIIAFTNLDILRGYFKRVKH